VRAVVVFGEGNEHVLVDGDLAVEVKVFLLVGVEVVQVEVDLGDGLPVRRRSVGDNKSLSVKSAPLRRGGPRCAGASRDLRRLHRGGPAGGEQRGPSGISERDRLAGVQGVAGVPDDQAGVFQLL
jgi:hypothetical protein